MSTAEPRAALSHRQILVIFSGLMLGMLLAALDQTIVATALPVIVGDLHGLNHISWVVTAYLLTSTASTPLYGKISDLYGRKIVFQTAIVVFLLGSILAGLSQNMGQLIATRALQGLGGGGLIALAMAIIGDVVSPRERGRYQGYFGAVFAVSSVAGPLLGGFFTQHLSWRWIFYVNVPIGIVALIVTSAVLNIPFEKRSHKIDYLGSTLMVGGVSAVLLVTVWGGSEYAWSSAQMIGLAVAGFALLATFVWWESRASEPILPLHLFRNSVFSVSSAIAFLLGLVMFGAIIYLPLYLQVVHGASPTESGLLLLPLMVGILTTSIASGRAISARGRYRVFPIVGTLTMSVGLYLFHYLHSTTPLGLAMLYMVILGAGMGLTMQVLVLATQNSVDIRDMGIATSANTFFRSMGGAFGTALFGAVLNARLDHWLPTLAAQHHVSLPGKAAGALSQSPEVIRHLPDPFGGIVIESFVRSLDTVFMVALPLGLLAFALSWFLREVELKRAPGLDRSETLGVPGGELPVSAEASQEAMARHP